MYKHGIDCVEKADTILSGKRVGLITNYTALNHEFKRTADILLGYMHRNMVLTAFIKTESMWTI